MSELLLEAFKREFLTYVYPEGWPEDKKMGIDEYKWFLEETTKSKDAIANYWARWAEQLYWKKKWIKVLDDGNPPFYRWFVGGETNLAYLCTDWQLQRGRKNKVALIWEGEPVDERGRPREVKKFTYYELWREHQRVAYALREKLGVKRGEVVTIYMPMVPELALVMLALQRMGVAHSAVFSGFGAKALADRILDARSRIVVTADGMWRRGKKIRLKPVVDEAIELCEQQGHKVEKVIVVKRLGDGVEWVEGRDVWWDDLLEGVPAYVEVEPAWLGHEDLSFVLYTSGTTGRPKAAQHSVGGYATYVYATMHMVFDVQEDDIYFATADIGWITGHSYNLYGPLMTGLTFVWYEGAPDYPAHTRWYQVLERYGVTKWQVAPTGVRALMKHPVEDFLKYDVKVKLVSSIGEPLNPEAWRWLFETLKRRAYIVSSWWMTETGAICISNAAGPLHPGAQGRATPLKPGTNGMSLPGTCWEVVDEEGRPCAPGQKGYLVATCPWPGMLMTVYGDPQRYVEAYFGKYRKLGKWYYYAGDFCVKDQDGYFWVLGRADDVLKVAGHRIGTYEVESAMLMHPAVAEAAVVGLPDPIKGEVPLVFTVLKNGYQPSEELAAQLRAHLRETLGPVVGSDAVIAFVDKLPKTRSGKIMRRLLRAVAAGLPLGDTTTLEDETSVEEARRAYEALKPIVEELKRKREVPAPELSDPKA